MLFGTWSRTPGSELRFEEPCEDSSDRLPAWQVARNDRFSIYADIRLEHLRDLADAIGLDAASARALTPSQLLLAAWDRRGSGILSALEGDFALVVWDKTARQLFLARDALGRRPLHYAIRDSAVAFASLPLRLAGWRGTCAPDLDRLATYLMTMPESGPASFFAGVNRVEPGGLVRITDAAIAVERWWQPDLTPLSLSIDDAVAAARREVRRAIAGALATVAPPFAAQLSSGLDSSLVVVETSAVLGADKDLLTITGAPDGPVSLAAAHHLSDESAAAAQTAAALGLSHRRAGAAPQSLLAIADRWQESAQRPFRNPNNFAWLDATYAAAAEFGSSLLLEGYHGNFTLSWDGQSRVGELLFAGQWRHFWREWRALRRCSGGTGLWVLLRTMVDHLPPRVVNAWSTLFPSRFDEVRASFLRADHPSVRRARKEAGLLKYRLDGAASSRNEPWRRIAHYLHADDEGLANTMIRRRFGLQMVDPLAARRLVELALRLPAHHAFRDGVGRRLAKALLVGRVSPAVATDAHAALQGADWHAARQLATADMAAEIEAIAADPELNRLFDVEAMRISHRRWLANPVRDRLPATLAAARFCRWARAQL